MMIWRQWQDCYNNNDTEDEHNYKNVSDDKEDDKNNDNDNNNDDKDNDDDYDDDVFISDWWRTIWWRRGCGWLV